MAVLGTTQCTHLGSGSADGKKPRSIVGSENTLHTHPLVTFGFVLGLLSCHPRQRSDLELNAVLIWPRIGFLNMKFNMLQRPSGLARLRRASAAESATTHPRRITRRRRATYTHASAEPGGGGQQLPLGWGPPAAGSSNGSEARAGWGARTQQRKPQASSQGRAKRWGVAVGPQAPMSCRWNIPKGEGEP